MPLQPRATTWRFPAADSASEHGVVAIGADLQADTLLRAYRKGLFPMPDRNLGTIAWWSPDPRGVLPLDGLVVSRSLQRSCRRFDVSIDRDFASVIDRCAHLPRHGSWIDQDVIDAYTTLHRLGWAHSVETWDGDELVGGLYGVAIGGFFAGESMFHTETDASKVALVSLVRLLRDIGATLLDVQWSTDHLKSLGVIDLPRSQYLQQLDQAVRLDVAWPERPPGPSGLPAYLDDVLATVFPREDHGADG